MQPSSEQSDTPRVDSEVESWVLENKNHPHTDWVPASFARELERENARLREVLRKLHSDCTAHDFNEHWDTYKAAEQLLRAQ